MGGPAATKATYCTGWIYPHECCNADHAASILGENIKLPPEIKEAYHITMKFDMTDKCQKDYRARMV